MNLFQSLKQGVLIGIMVAIIAYYSSLTCSAFSVFYSPYPLQQPKQTPLTCFLI